MAPPTSPAKTSLPQRPKRQVPSEITNTLVCDPGEQRLCDDSSEGSSSNSEGFDSDSVPSFCILSGAKPEPDTPITPAFSDAQQSSRAPNDGAGYTTVSYKHRKENSSNKVKKEGQSRRHPKQVFNYIEDNPATARYRKHFPHDGKFILHKDCSEIEPDRAKLYDMLIEMGVRQGSFIRPPQHIKDRELLIWGNHGQVEKTLADLKRRLGPRQVKIVSRISTKRDDFASEHSNIGPRYRSTQKEILKEALLKLFQRDPEPGRNFPFVGTFLWPEDEIRPTEILGSSLEAFDPVRIEQQCHIVFEDKESQFKIMASKESSVLETMERIKGTMKEYVVKCSRRVTTNLIEPPTKSTTRKAIILEPGPSLGSATASSRIPVLRDQSLHPIQREELGKQPADMTSQDPVKPDGLVKQTTDMTFENHRQVEESLKRCISNLIFHRSQVNIRINFGTFALTVYRNTGAESLAFRDFVENLAMTATRGDLIRDLYIKKDATTIMDRVNEAEDIFVPVDNSICTLAASAPSFSARFEFQKDEDKNQPAVALDVEMRTKDSDEPFYEKTHSLWTRVDRHDNTVPLSIYMVRLEGGVSWKLQASTENTINKSRIQPKMMEFADSVKLRKSSKSNVFLTGENIFQWEKDLPGVLRPNTYQQKTCFRYLLAHDIDWTVEISRYDTYDDPTNLNLPTKTCWAATMFNKEWDNTFAPNAALGIGQTATWEPQLNTFFPPGNGKTPAIEGVHPGIVSLLRTINIVAMFLDGIKNG